MESTVTKQLEVERKNIAAVGSKRQTFNAVCLKFLYFSFPGIFCRLLFHMKEGEDKVIVEITLNYSKFMEKHQML